MLIKIVVASDCREVFFVYFSQDIHAQRTSRPSSTSPCRCLIGHIRCMFQWKSG